MYAVSPSAKATTKSNTTALSIIEMALWAAQHFVMLSFPSAERNAAPIAEVLKKELGKETRRVLELASGSGQHVTLFAAVFPHVQWYPTDIEEVHLASIRGYVATAGLCNVEEPRKLDASLPWEEWGVEEHSLDAIVNTNLIHISPIAVCEGLIAAAGHLLRPGGLLIFYGPFKVNGSLTPQSNVDFDLSLRSRNPLWGIRDIQEVSLLCQKAGLDLQSEHDMPSNNKIFVFASKSPSPL